MTRLRKFLRPLSGLLLVGTLGFWAWAGAHRGWSMDRVPSIQVDEFTGIEYTVYEDRFVPGLEIVAAGVAASGVIFGLTFLPLFRPKP